MAKKEADKEADVEEKPAEGGEAGAEGAEGGGKKKKGKLVLILAIAVPLLLGGIGAGVFFSGILGGKKEEVHLPPECIAKNPVKEEEGGDHGKKDDHAKDEKHDAKSGKKDEKHGDEHAEEADTTSLIPGLTEDEQKACNKAREKIAKDAKKAAKKAAAGGGGGGHGEAKKDDGHGGGGEEGGGAGASNFFDLPDMVVNLDTGSKRQTFLKISVSLELDDPSDKGALEAVMPRIVDQFQTYLRELRVEDLRGSAGVYRLRQELLARVQPAVEPIEIKDVLFREILVQ